MNALGRLVHEQTLGKIVCVIFCAAMLFGRLTAVEPYTFNRPVMWAIIIPAAIVTLIAYFSFKPETAKP